MKANTTAASANAVVNAHYSSRPPPDAAGFGATRLPSARAASAVLRSATVVMAGTSMCVCRPPDCRQSGAPTSRRQRRADALATRRYGVRLVIAATRTGVPARRSSGLPRPTGRATSGTPLRRDERARPARCANTCTSRRTPPRCSASRPVGLPRARAAAAGVTTFRGFLAGRGAGEWSSFYDVADDPTDISTRPFYPSTYLRKGAKRREHLVHGLGLSWAELLRTCERAQPNRRAASPLFWTCGGTQVGKGAIAAWKRLQGEDDAHLWPFDGTFHALVDRGGELPDRVLRAARPPRR
jgi:hypothetical protein